jgi:hypothetical protein
MYVEKPTAQECKNTLTAVGDALYVIGGKWKLRCYHIDARRQ